MPVVGTAAEVAAIFRRVLERDDIHADSDFFLMGGDSLLATRVLSAMAREFGVELTITQFADSPTPNHLAALMASVTL